MRLLTVIILLFCAPCFGQQKLVEGQVVDQYGKPVDDCKVLMGHMCVAGKTNATGSFSIKYLPPGKNWTLVIFKPGYEPFRHSFSRRDLPVVLKATLLPQTIYQRPLALSAPGDNNWEKWGALFTRTFLGESENARFCTIENVGAISFQYDPLNYILRATCKEMLVITNTLLGYKINYRLDKYEYHFGTTSITYTGVPFFEELNDGYMFTNKYAKRRLKAYKGSTMHFIRAIYHGRIAEEGFKARLIERTMVLDSVRLRKDIFCCVDSFGRRTYKPNYRYKQKLVEEMSDDLTVADLLIRDSAQTFLSFKKVITVIYSGEREADQYLRYTPGKPHNKQRSYLKITNPENKLAIDASGYYAPSAELATEGYMSWEKIADLLPVDYDPEKKL